MLHGLRWTSIAAYLYFATLTLGVPFLQRNSQSVSDSQFQSTGTLTPLTQQNSSPDPLAGNAAAQRTVTATKRWLAGTMSTPGMSAQLREISRGQVNGKLEVQYHIFVTGAPKDQNYTLVDWPPNHPDPAPSIAGLSILDDGLVVCAGRATDQCSHPNKPEKKDAPLKLVFYPLDGEIYRLALVSQDQNAKIFFAVIPAPIQATDNGCTLEVVSLRLKNELVLIRGKGFQPNESVGFESTSYEQTHTLTEQVDTNGEYQLPMQPFLAGKSGGTTEIKLSGAKCAPVLKFQWGN
ncbi:MAG TPA: hypothetical protein VK818_11870 [Methylomirabilota bacterium]|jgi:hypothetical protein|nr:hypothetical protein [Methylomirabilota bacterium]